MMPKRFRKRLEDLGDTSVWITNAMDGTDHLEVRPDSSFQRFFKQISALGNDPMLLDFRRYYFGAAQEVELDKAGRVLIPASFRQQVGFSDSCSFVGVDDERFELWRPEDIDARYAKVSADPQAMLAFLASKGV